MVSIYYSEKVDAIILISIAKNDNIDIKDVICDFGHKIFTFPQLICQNIILLHEYQLIGAFHEN